MSVPPCELRNADLAVSSKPSQDQITQRGKRMHPYLRLRFLDSLSIDCTPVHQIDLAG